ncbi:tripartite tricarboxylate transporter TctB family protein [Skermanella pratensis]|uniref:tripartite tricarboxylate transporter TctB family protein n=1 Tax=Skermanella pratensis TaxID=2233999 RepID=UPI00130142C9|nr:tripartite tricarboxylate transporter TctB family protein [Skermanella pratensis]
MEDFTRVTVNFETSHLIFPTMVAVILTILGVAILITNRRQIAGAGAYWRDVLGSMDKVRFFGTIVLTVVYFSLMVPVGDIWPNTGLGFLICSIPYVFLTGVLFLHHRSLRDLLPVAVTAVVAPTLVWWLFTDLFSLTLP